MPLERTRPPADHTPNPLKTQKIIMAIYIKLKILIERA
jgi:hypothetical protein